MTERSHGVLIDRTWNLKQEAYIYQGIIHTVLCICHYQILAHRCKNPAWWMFIICWGLNEPLPVQSSLPCSYKKLSEFTLWCHPQISIANQFPQEIYLFFSNGDCLYLTINTTINVIICACSIKSISIWGKSWYIVNCQFYPFN